VAQSLYEKKHITYPRTESTALEESLKDKAKNVLEALRRECPCKDEIVFNESKKVFNNEKVESHSAIIPTYIIPKGLSEDERTVYDAVKNKYCEPDPITSNWENSKQMIADGKIGVMCLGSWAVGQFKALSKTPEDIKFMPVPARKDGKALVQIGHDLALAVSKYSKNKELAKEFIKFFIGEYPKDSNMISPMKNAELPAFLKDVQNMEMKESITMTTEQSKAFDTIQKESLINLYDSTWIKKVVETGLGTQSKSFDDFMKELNKNWVKGIEKASASK
jgi:ABC-type glycerol-3-phosphate transport system substrate-binding protein